MDWDEGATAWQRSGGCRLDGCHGLGATVSRRELRLDATESMFARSMVAKSTEIELFTPERCRSGDFGAGRELVRVEEMFHCVERAVREGFRFTSPRWYDGHCLNRVNGAAEWHWKRRGQRLSVQVSHVR